ncbi:hypothetical protein A3Q56_06020 [Intoshia linei]|uniref:Palmitoyl-protein thioesterase 1 n=1 Tax=Intoshia linei TaxID=1819745 RepID=A0A177AXM9_9BILA|nr:hypothetical protein A3Q56_06020 [Intoshia linei]
MHLKKLRKMTNRTIIQIAFTNSKLFDNIFSRTFPLFQLAFACQQIKHNKLLKNGYDAIGFSQGGLFLRWVSQTCGSNPDMINLMTIGSPHRGVSHVPLCGSTCDYIIRYLQISHFAYITDIVTDFITFMAYWHDIKYEALYQSTTLTAYMNYKFLPISDNVKTFSMIQFTADT